MATIAEILKEELIKKLASRTDYVDKCWCYRRPNDNGYATIIIDKRTLLVHRVSASIYLGLDIDNSSQQANHKIECSNRNCWNPDHLYVGTQAENMIDLSTKPCRLCGGLREGKFSYRNGRNDVKYCIPCFKAKQKRNRALRKAKK